MIYCYIYLFLIFVCTSEKTCYGMEYKVYVCIVATVKLASFITVSTRRVTSSLTSGTLGIQDLAHFQPEDNLINFVAGFCYRMANLFL